ncbi:MAG: phage holin family protein [Actinomycetes bacterium]
MNAFLARTGVNALALAAAAWLVQGITLTGATRVRQVLSLLVVAIIFGLVNAVLKPIVRLLTFPLYLLTLGLFTFVVNAGMLLITSALADTLRLSFHVAGFGSALAGAVVIFVVSMLASLAFGGKSR